MEYTKELHNAIKGLDFSADSIKIFVPGSGIIRTQQLIPCLLAEITRLQSLTQWVRVEDRLPEVKKNTLFLCQFRDFQNNWKIDTRTFWADSKSFSGSCKVEYWTPLPEGVK